MWVEVSRSRLRANAARYRMTLIFHQEGSSDLTHLVESITKEIEQFNSLIDNERPLLQGAAGRGRADRKQARRQLKRIRASAAEVADRAQEAIHRMTQTA